MRKYIKGKNNVFGLVIDYDYDNYIKASLIGKNEVSNSIVSAVSNSLNRIRYDMAMSNLGLSQNVINRLNARVKIENIILLSKDINKKSNGQNSTNDIVGVVAVIVFTMPFFFIITTLVQMIDAEINE